MPKNAVLSSWRQLLTVALILLGVGLSIYYGNRTVVSYRHVRFIQEQGFNIAGELTWLLIFGALGYGFGSQWEAISDLSRDFTGLLVGIVTLVAGVYFLVRIRSTQAESASN